MNEHVLARGAKAPTLMATWLASGGAVEALAETDAGAARAARSRRRQSAGDDGLQAYRSTANYPFCADDGLQAGRTSAVGPFCVSDDDGLQVGRTSGFGPFCGSADDGLQAIAVTTVRCNVF